MPKRSSTRKESEPKDPSQLARHVLDAIVPPEEADDPQNEQPEKNPAAVALGRLGGKKGGKARAEKLTAKQRSEIAKKAAESRWKKKNEKAQQDDNK